MSDEEIKKINKYNIKRRIKQSKMKRKIRHTQRKIKTLRVMLRLLMIVGLCFLCYHIVYMKSWRLPQDTFSKLDSPSLKISNNKIVPSYKILAAIRQIEIPDKAIFLIRTDEIRQSILKIDPIQDVYVRRFWFPARLDIIIKERVPVILVAPNEKVQPIAYFTRDGKLIGHEYMPLNVNYKTVKVLAYCTKDDDYRKWDIKKQNFVKKLARTVEFYSSEPIEYIDMRNPADIYIKIKPVLLRLGPIDEISLEENGKKRLSKLPSLLPQVKLLDKNIKYLDLRWDKVSYLKLNND